MRFSIHSKRSALDRAFVHRDEHTGHQTIDTLPHDLIRVFAAITTVQSDCKSDPVEMTVSRSLRDASCPDLGVLSHSHITKMQYGTTPTQPANAVLAFCFDHLSSHMLSDACTRLSALCSRNVRDATYTFLQEVVLEERQAPGVFNLPAPAIWESTLPLRLLDLFTCFTTDEDGNKRTLHGIDKLIHGMLPPSITSCHIFFCPHTEISLWSSCLHRQVCW